jgi:apolipoprotein N-acyltransferase
MPDARSALLMAECRLARRRYGRTRGLLGAWFWSLVSAALLLCSYPLTDAGFLAWVALAPWVVVVVRARRSTVAWLTWPVWFVWWAVMVGWLRYATGPGMLALAAYMSAYFVAGAYLIRLFHRRLHVPAVAALPVIWVALEQVRGHLMTGFAWFFLGHTQHGYLSLIQIADTFGVPGVTFVVAAVNGLVVDLLTAPIFQRRSMEVTRGGPRLRRRVAISAAAVLALVAATAVYGQFRLAQGRRAMTVGPRIAAIQGNIPQDIVLEGRSDAEIMAEHVGLTRPLLGGDIDLVVWPETMVPGVLNDEFLRHTPGGPQAETVRLQIERSQSYRNEIVSLARTGDVPFLVGAETRRDGGEFRRRYNTALLLLPDGRVAATYDKMHLVPFGEYLPLKDVFPWLIKLTPYDYDYTVTPGTRATVFPLGRWRFAVAICFEDTVPEVPRELCYDPHEGKRVDFLVNISNDGWFQASSELPQHLAICVFRAVENRVGIVRAVNTGISAFIDSNGRVVQELRVDGRSRGVAGTLVGSVAIDRRVSPYSRHGEWFGWLVTGLTVTAAVVWMVWSAATRLIGGRTKKMPTLGKFRLTP